MKKWEAIFSEADRQVLKKAGFGKKQSFGEKPALLIIDVNKTFVGVVAQPASDAGEGFQKGCGEAGWAAIQNIKKLLAACRARNIPVIYTTTDARTRQFCWGAVKDSAPFKTLNLEAQEIMDDIKPLPSELVLAKTKASAFFGSPLVSILRNLNVDCLLFSGTSTSGCVRAAIVDAFSNDFPCFLVEECTFDRFELSHLVNLWDINAKYADVISIDEALAYVAGLP